MQKKTKQKHKWRLFFFCSGNHATPLIFLHEITPTGRPIIIINFASSDKNKKKNKSPDSSQSHFLSVCFVYLFCVLWSTFPRISCHLPSNSNIFQKSKKQKNKTKQNEKTKFFLTEFSVITVNVINI